MIHLRHIIELAGSYHRFSGVCMNKEIRIDIRQCIRDVLHRWISILVLGIVVFALVSLLTPTPGDDRFRASATVYAVAVRDIGYISPDFVLRTATMLRSYAEVAMSRKVIDSVATLMGEPDSTALQKMVSVEYSESSSILTLFVRSSDPDYAVTAVNTITEVFISEIRSITGQNNVLSLDMAADAVLESSGVVRQWTLRVGAAFASVFFYVVIIVLMCCMTTRIISVEDAGLNGRFEITGIVPYNDKSIYDSLDRIAVKLQVKKDLNIGRVLLICGCHPRVGTTSIAVNLSQSLVLSGYRTIYIDADMRKDRRHKQMWGTVGLSDFLTEHAALADIIIKTQHDKMDCISSGTETASVLHLLNSERMSNLMDMLRPVYDFILIDSPAQNNAVDAEILIKQADAALLIASWNVTKKERVEHVASTIERAGGTVEGVILNQMEVKRYNRYMDHPDRYASLLQTNDGKSKVSNREAKYTGRHVEV